MRTIVIGDIHGCYKELKVMISELMNRGKYTPETDRLIFIGDYIDRGENPRLAVKYVRELQEMYGENVIALLGNHEDMLLDYLEHNGWNWVFNGYKPTMLSYQGYKNEFEEDIAWMKSLPLYYEDAYFVYVHAGVNKEKLMEDQDYHTMLWAREEFYLDPRPYDKRVVFGHTPTSFLGSDSSPVRMNRGNDIAIDTGCVFGGKLTALVIENEQIIEYCQVGRGEETISEGHTL